MPEININYNLEDKILILLNEFLSPNACPSWPKSGCLIKPLDDLLIHCVCQAGLNRIIHTNYLPAKQSIKIVICHFLQWYIYYSSNNTQLLKINHLLLAAPLIKQNYYYYHVESHKVAHPVGKVVLKTYLLPYPLNINTRDILHFNIIGEDWIKIKKNLLTQLSSTYIN